MIMPSDIDHTPYFRSLSNVLALNAVSFTVSTDDWAGLAIQGLRAATVMQCMGFAGVVDLRPFQVREYNLEGTRFHRWHSLCTWFRILLSGFLAINLMVCYLEMCLYRQRDTMETRKIYWKNRAMQEGVSPARAFMTSRVSWAPGKILAPSFWADSYATYANYDAAYVDDSSCGFNVDIANGFWTLLPTLILLVNFTSPMIPALVVGRIGLVIFYQWIYVTGMYVGSFFVSKSHHLLSWAEVFIFIWVINVIWILLSAQGFYVSAYLVMEQHYGILGFPATHP